MRYLANMNQVAFFSQILLVLAPGIGAAQPASLAPATGYGAAGQAIEGGSLLPAAASMSTTKPIAVNDLRTVLQLQKARQPDSPPAERQLTTQERNELRQQLRQQRDAVSASN